MSLIAENLSQLYIGALIVFLSWALGLVSKAVSWALRAYQKLRVAAYISAVSLTEPEILYALEAYIKPKYSLSDPSRYSEPREAIDVEDKCLFAYVDNFIRDGASKHLFVYADSGMGKTTFLINYFHRNKARLFRRKKDMVFVSLSKPTSEEEITRTPLSKQRSTILMLDALDEDPYIYGDAEARVNRLLTLAANYKVVIVTCRSQFFANDASLPSSSGVPRAGPTRAAESKEYEIAKVYISPFSDKQITKYLRRKFPSLAGVVSRYKARALIKKVPYLPVRPMLLAHISDVLSVQEDLRTCADIYQAIISSWAQRENRWINPRDLLNFSSDLAFELYFNREQRGGEFCSVEELEQLASASNVQIKTSALTGRSLLNRAADGGVKFSHRSIMEYFVANRLSSTAAGSSIALTDQMAIFLLEVLGVSDGASEFGPAESSMRLQTVSPTSRCGYSTNFGLFTPRPEGVMHLASLMATSIRARDGLEYDGGIFSDVVSDFFASSGGGGKEAELRFCIPFSQEGPYLDCYASLWGSEGVVLSHMLIDEAGLKSALGFSPDREVCVVGVGDGVERMRWRCEIRSYISSSGSQVINIERNPRIGFRHHSLRGGLEMRLVSGRAASGPLSAFGILSGGSYLPVERRMFARFPPLDRSASSRIGEIIEQESAKVPASDRWTVR